jgi:hypothetical protein
MICLEFCGEGKTGEFRASDIRSAFRLRNLDTSRQARSIYEKDAKTARGIFALRYNFSSGERLNRPLGGPEHELGGPIVAR